MGKRNSWRIASIRGVDLNIHFSLIFILLYISLSAAMQFPLVVRAVGLTPEAVTGGPVFWGIVFAFSLFLSVLLHEWGHVLVAQRLGVKVKSITLMMLGGVSEMEEIPEKRFHELKIAIVGPAVSFILAGALFFVGGITTSENLILFSYWLGQVNLTLGIFNLLPAFPMDGGRVVRSFLASRQGMLIATRRAVSVGKVFAALFAILGFLQFNILLMFIAFFLFAAGQQEYLMLSTKDQVKGMRVSDAMTWVQPLTADGTLTDVAHLMARFRVPVIPVLRPQGRAWLLSYNELQQTPAEHWDRTQVFRLTSDEYDAVDVDESLESVLPKLMRSSVGALPVAKNGSLVGVLRSASLGETLQFRALEGKRPGRAA